MDQLESVGTTPSHIAVSDRADAHRSSSDNPKSGRRARHGVSTTGCPSIVGLFPDTLELGSNPIRPVSLQTRLQLTQNPSYKSPRVTVFEAHQNRRRRLTSSRPRLASGLEGP